MVARKDKGIRTPEDLKGRKIAVTLGTTADYFMDTFLAVHEIARQQMTVVDLKPEQMGPGGLAKLQLQGKARSVAGACTRRRDALGFPGEVLGNRILRLFDEAG